MWLSALLLAGVLAAVASEAPAAPVTRVRVEGVVGATRQSWPAWRIPPGGSMTWSIAGRSTRVRVREVYPDTANQPEYRYDLLAGSDLVGRRQHTGYAFGPTSVFYRLPDRLSAATRVTVRNTGEAPVLISRVESVDLNVLRSLQEQDRFGLFGLVDGHRRAAELDADVTTLATQLPVAPDLYHGVAFEVCYANRPLDLLRPVWQRELDAACRHQLSALPIIVSWWVGTPLHVPDGLGGRFGDLTYQQITWSESDRDRPADPRLAELFGLTDPRYGLTTPNQWSNTPWLTMNSDRLNAHRKQSMHEVLPLLLQDASERNTPMNGLVMENEPRYWDTQIDASFRGPKRDWCWADFNPLTVRAAAADGVTLDPADGLDRQERLWLLANVTRYMQETCDWAHALSPASLPIYSHSLQFPGFPGDTLNHPMSEYAFTPGSLTGLEVMFGAVRDFESVREWGPWANVNREETDGLHIDWHLWDLRLTYIMGGALYNSYNWPLVGSHRVMAYYQRFARERPVSVASAPMKPQPDGSAICSLSLATRAANLMNLQVDPGHTGELFVSVRANDRLVAWTRTGAPDRDGWITARYGQAFEAPRPDTMPERVTQPDPVLRVQVTTVTGKPLAVRAGNAALDLRIERNLSLYTIHMARHSR